MKVENNDLELFLEEFFSDKYRKFDIGAIGIITDNQMITRFNKESDGNKGAGTHLEAEGSILSDIFGFDEDLFLGFGYNQKLFNALDVNHKKALREVVVIKYINNNTGNLIMIYLPMEQETITTEQLRAIKYINKAVEDARKSRKISKPIKILATNRRREGVSEFNTMRYKVIPYLESCIDDTYKQSISEENIIAQKTL